MCAPVCGGQRLTLGVFFYSPPYFLSHSLSLNLKITELARSVDQLSPGILPSTLARLCDDSPLCGCWAVQTQALILVELTTYLLPSEPSQSFHLKKLLVQ